MIDFWADITPLKTATLVIAGIPHSPVYCSAAPVGGWTRELLVAKLSPFAAYGANAFLDGRFVGSTEV